MELIADPGETQVEKCYGYMVTDGDVSLGCYCERHSGERINENNGDENITIMYHRKVHVTHKSRVIPGPSPR